MLSQNEQSVITLADFAYNSLWYLGTALNSPEKTCGEVYEETLGMVSGINVPSINAGTAILGAYALFVLPREVLFQEFSRALCGQNKLSWSGFVWDDSALWAPDPSLTNAQESKSEHNVLGGIRNAIAHGNIEVEFPSGDDKRVVLHLWSQLDASNPQKRNVRVTVQDLARFVMDFHSLFLAWQNNGKTF